MGSSNVRFRVDKVSGDPIYEHERTNAHNPGVVEKGGKILGHKPMKKIYTLQARVNNVWVDVHEFEPIEEKK